MSLPEPGKYDATVTKALIYGAESGAVMVAVHCQIDEQTSITAYQCIILKDGSFSDNGMKTVKEALGFPGGDLGAMYDYIHALTDHPVSIDVENDEYNGKVSPKVKWLNPRGGGGMSKEPIDRAALLAKYGAKFRAFSGGTAATAPKPAAPKPSTPPPAAPPAAPPATAAPAAPPSDMMTVWARVCECYGDKATEAWGVLQSKAGKAQEQITPEEWGGYLVKLNAKFPPGATAEAEDTDYE